MTAEISGLNHAGSGDFLAESYELSTTTKADAASFTYASVPYLARTKTEIKTAIRIDNRNNKYSFRTGDIQLNNLKLNAEGFFQLVNDSTYDMDIAFNTPSNEFREILSLIPAVYKEDF
jgi:hypothetical protein